MLGVYLLMDELLNHRELHLLVECAGYHFELMLSGEFHEVYGIAADTYGELRIFFRMLHGIFKHLAVEHIHIQVVCTLCEVSVHHGDEVFHTLFVRRAKALGDDAEGVGNAVL